MIVEIKYTDLDGSKNNGMKIETVEQTGTSTTTNLIYSGRDFLIPSEVASTIGSLLGKTITGVYLQEVPSI